MSVTREQENKAIEEMTLQEMLEQISFSSLTTQYGASTRYILKTHGYGTCERESLEGIRRWIIEHLAFYLRGYVRDRLASQ